jgi:putative ABC transport system ATP-binding protein
MVDNAKVGPIVRVQGVSRSFYNAAQEIQALRDVDLSLERGNLVAIKGRSGSGKTTLLNIIGGLDRPTSGEVYFESHALGTLSESQLTNLRLKHIGFVFQSFSLLPTYSAFENVELILRIACLDRKERVMRVQHCLRLVGLMKWMQHRPSEMSGGQQQRVAIARALATRPNLILADEPTGELDTNTSHQIFSLFRKIVEHQKSTILVTTHDPIIDEYADLLYYLKDGRLDST